MSETHPGFVASVLTGNLPVDGYPLGVLHLGKRSQWLVDSGYATIGDIRRADPVILRGIPLVGRSTVDELTRTLLALSEALTPSGDVDWAVFCRKIGLPLLGTIGQASTGQDFLRAIPAVLYDVAQHLHDPVSVAIFRDRICQPPGRQKTLVEIAHAATPVVTRERIRQREKKLLEQLAGGLLNDDYDKLPFHFDPAFTRWWRMAADALSDVDEVEVMTFIEILTDAWSVPRSAVLEKLPFIVAIVTGEPQLSGEFRAAAKINARWLGVVSDNTRKIPVVCLRLGRHAAGLVEADYGFVGDLVEAMQSGTISRAGPPIARHVMAHLDVLATCLTPLGDVDWDGYREAFGLRALPLQSSHSPKNFCCRLTQDIESLLVEHQVTKRASEVFRLRTGVDSSRRLTLHQVAAALRTHPPTIKREETVLLQWLSDVLVERDFSCLRVWLDHAWLVSWTEAQEEFRQSNGTYVSFVENLAWRWRLKRHQIIEAAPALWSVFNGYPDGRPKAAISLPTAMAEPVGTIRLKGFRKLH